ncbi:MAG: heme-binding protein, partial [Planctomycetota bacterium]|nr:heme-binding protein [Planctomycetota bacterium]
SDRDIAMTAPVEMTMDKDLGRAVDMGFMYRTPDMGAAGEAGRVMVEDIQPMTVVTIGVRGRVEGAATVEALAELEAWLAARPGWEAAGNPRLMGYNGPSVPRRRQFSEVQIPVRRVER